MTEAPILTTHEVGGQPGDTFDLVMADEPCDEQHTLADRYVLGKDSTYREIFTTATGCGTETSVADTMQQSGRYTVDHDTLTFLVGDGDEEFQHFITRRWPDSLVGRNRTGLSHFRRRGSAARAR